MKIYLKHSGRTMTVLVKRELLLRYLTTLLEKGIDFSIEHKEN